MNLKNQFLKSDIEVYKGRITKLENQIKKLIKTKEMWEFRLKAKLRELE